jgi:hypothetical protein
MSWSLRKFFQSKERTELEQQVREQRGQFAHKIIENDRRAMELRQMLQGSLALREGRGRETDR